MGKACRKKISKSWCPSCPTAFSVSIQLFGVLKRRVPRLSATQQTFQGRAVKTAQENLKELRVIEKFYKELGKKCWNMPENSGILCRILLHNRQKPTENMER